MNTRSSKITQTLVAAVVAMMLSLPMTQGGGAWAGADPFIGEIEMVGFNFAPQGWAACDGQQIAISQNTALFSLLGTMYGGDGRTTFALPDLRGRVAIHRSDVLIQGQTGGAGSVTLNTGNLPAHTHTATTLVTVTGTAGIPAQSGNGTTDTPSGTTVLARSPRNLQYSTAAPNVTMTAAAISANTTASTSVGITGSGQPFSIMPPYLMINYIIALQGIFPPRD